MIVKLGTRNCPFDGQPWLWVYKSRVI